MELVSIHHVFRRKTLIFLVVILVNIVTLLYISKINMKSNMPSSSVYIWIPKLVSTEVPFNQSMFFIETNRKPVVELTPRQTCSVESAARINPDRLVFVLFLSPKLKCQNKISAMFSLVTNYHNVRFRHIDLISFTRDTPIEDFVQSGIMEKGNWPVEQYSDMLRILTLWKFGGIYMDLDVVSLKPIPLINFIGGEYPGNDLLASSVIGIQNKDIAEEAIHMFKDNWDGQIWAQNGPILFTNLLKELCGTDDIMLMYSSDAKCNNFTIFLPEVFGPIAYYEWDIFFNSSEVEYVRKTIKNSMAVHFWNKLTGNETVMLRSKQPYAEIANKYCPIVSNTGIDTF